MPLEQIAYADQAGIDEAWLGEHRFSRHGLLSGIWSFLGNVAGRTKNIRIGTAVIVLPLHNPVLVAEEVAMLDVISGGRVNFGIGAGYQRQEFDGVGVDIDTSRERFQEAVDVIIKAWTEETLTYHGKFTNVDDVWVLPKPVQTPHPPLFQAVSTSPASVDFAASRQIQVITGGPTDIMGQAPEVIKLWRQKMDEYGHPHAHLDPAHVQVNLRGANHGRSRTRPDRSRGFLRPACCVRSAVMALLSECRWTRTATIAKGYEHWANRQNDRERRDDPGHAGLPPLRGDAGGGHRTAEAGAGGGYQPRFRQFRIRRLPHEKVMRSIELFATEVMPHFQEVPVA